MTVFYDAMELIERRLPNESPIDVFNRAVENVQADHRGPFQAGRRCDVPGPDAGQ